MSRLSVLLNGDLGVAEDLRQGEQRALQPPHVCQPARDGRCGPAQHPETRRLAHAVDGTAVRAPRPGSPPNGGREADRRRTWSELGLDRLGRYRSRLVTVRSYRHGGLASTGKAVDLKSTGPRGPWGFESLALRQLTRHSTAALSESLIARPPTRAAAGQCDRPAERSRIRFVRCMAVRRSASLTTCSDRRCCASGARRSPSRGRRGRAAPGATGWGGERATD
jgi:hypothetical protein